MELIAAEKVVILEEIGEQKTKSGIVVPASQGKGAPEIGRVLVIGTGKKPMPFEVGDQVVYRRYMENKIFVKVKDYNFIDFKDLLAVIKESPNEKNS